MLYAYVGFALILVIALLAMHKKIIKMQQENQETIHDRDKKIEELQGRYEALNQDQMAAIKKLSDELKTFRESAHATQEKQEETLQSLIAELKKTRDELNEQKKKLDFYTGIDEAVETLTVDVNAEEREQLLMQAEQQINAYATGILGENDEIQEDDSENPLDEEQSFARKYIETSNNNVFITGKAGTGKSFLLDVFRRTTTKKHIVLAPTGIAALNVNGATLHTTFGYDNLVKLDADHINKDTIKLNDEKQEVLRKVETIVIDEISMVRADTFDKIDKILRSVTETNEPFGGKQMILFGDLFQLPPVVKKGENDYLIDRYGGIFFFNSEVYREGKFQFIELTHNHRQKEDKQYFEILNRIRMGQSTNQDIEILNTRLSLDQSVYNRYINLFPTKAEAIKVNQEQLDQLKTREYKYPAKVLLDTKTGHTPLLETVFPILSVLKLKLGTSVMMVANDPSHRWVNGTLGIVKELSDNSIYVSFGPNKEYEIPQQEFDEYEIKYKDKKLEYETIFSVLQYPLIPAYAITIHKSQGQTYGNVSCDIEKCFTSGQAYVALSRCASLEGLHLKSKINASMIQVNHDVLKFYKSELDHNLLNDDLHLVRT